MNKFIEKAKLEVKDIYTQLNKMFGFADDGKMIVGEEITSLEIYENEKKVQIQNYSGGDDFVFVLEYDKRTGKWTQFYDSDPQPIEFKEVEKLFEGMKKRMLSADNICAIQCGLFGSQLGKLVSYTVN